MVGIVLFHVLMLLMGLGIATRITPAKQVGNVLRYLHNAIGITMPPPEQLRVVALIWIGSAIVTADGFLFLLVVIARLSNAR
ncbi:MAG: hypothetical protein WB566_12250 [Terriglobales bacterium]